MPRHRIENSSAAVFAALYSEQSRTGAQVNENELTDGDIVDVESAPDENALWVMARFQDGGDLVSGWLETRFLGPRVDASTTVEPVSEELFVRACAREELAHQSGENPGEHGVVADYLIALAMIETKLSNFNPKLSASDGIGPFLISTKDWDEFLEAFGVNSPYSAASRMLPLAQIAGAAYLCQRDYERFAELEQKRLPGTADPFVPSFLNLFHSRLVGVEGAHELFNIQRARAENPTVDQVLAPKFMTQADLANLKQDRKRFLGTAAAPETVESFFNKTAGILNEAFIEAFGLLKKHIPEFVTTPAGVAGGWLEIAQREKKAWEAGGLTEADAAGRLKIAEYFTATDHTPTGNAAWCGAFVAYCLREAGEPGASSIIKGAARAANWKTWGNMELRQRDRKIPDGAIVLLTPDPSATDSSGHVGFFLGFVSNSSKIKLLGGNQSNRVKESTFDANRVVAVRWLESADPAPNATDGTPVGNVTGTGIAGATNRDATILAGTIFGEARGESDAGREAVACVVLNRVRSNRYPSTIEKVCLQPSQFSCWNVKDPNRAKILKAISDNTDQIFLRCLAIAQSAIRGELADSTNGALHYHANTISPPNWARPPAAVSARIGSHIFYVKVK